MSCLTRILQPYNSCKHRYCYKKCRLFLLWRRKFALMYASLLTSGKSAGRCKQDKSCLERHELTKALSVDHGSTPCFFWSQTDRKKQYFSLIFMRGASELDLRSSIKIKDNSCLRDVIQLSCDAGKLLR